MSQPPISHKARTLQLEANDDAERVEKITDLFTDPHCSSAMAMMNLEPLDGVEISELLKQLRLKSADVQTGDTKTLEAMLAAQAQVLHKAFIKMVMQMAVAEHHEARKTYGGLAFKAQNLCRMTVATLADMKNPARPTYIRNTAFNQQVNLSDSTLSRNLPNDISESANELLCDSPALKEQAHATMDAGGTCPAVRTDSSLEAVAKGRRKNRRRQRDEPDERIEAWCV